MATIAAVTTFIQKGVVQISWEGFAASADVGTAQSIAGFPDKSVQITGTFTGSPTIVIEGSNDGTNFSTLVDPQGNALSFTAAALEQVLEVVRFIRPRLTAGTGGADIDVTLVGKAPLR